MQFRLAPSDTYKSKVKVPFLVDMGRTRHLEIVAEFKRLPHDELRALGKSFVDNEDNEDKDAEILRANLVGWEAFKDFDGQEVGFDQDNLDTALNVTEIRRALLKTFLESLGDPEARNRKN